MKKKTQITVQATINQPVQVVWTHWNEPSHITKWCFADISWHAPRAENTLKVGSKLNVRMEAKDGSFGFDFGSVYDEIIPNSLIVSTMGDGRKIKVSFIPQGKTTQVIETFDAEDMNSVEAQREGWQSILNNFKKYSESK